MLAVFEKTIRDNAGSQPPQSSYADALAAGKIELYDPYPGYVEYTKRSLDIDRLKAADMRVLVEPMWGAGAGWIPRLLAGGRIRVTEIHSERNPWFGGVNPEPIAPNINESLGILAGGGYDLGLLLDGDADRAGAADEKGTFIHQLQVMGLLMYYLLEHRGMREPVVSTINETSMVGRLGKIYDVPVYETSVGFKYVGPKMIETGAMMGGEESGGYGFGMHLPERDGIYADLLLLDLFIREREKGRWPVSAAVQHLHDIAGPSFYLRTDVHVDRATYPALKARLLVELREQAPSSVAGHPVVRTDALDTNDGFKFWLDDGSWLLVRFSGTEPLVRVYAEATTAEERDAILDAGRRAGARRMTDEQTPQLLRTSAGIARRDPGGHAALRSRPSPTRCGSAWQISRELAIPDRYRRRRPASRLLGMGGSAVCGDLVRAIFSRPAAPCRSSRCATTSCRRGSTRRRSSSRCRTRARPRRRSRR